MKMSAHAANMRTRTYLGIDLTGLEYIIQQACAVRFWRTVMTKEKERRTETTRKNASRSVPAFIEKETSDIAEMPESCKKPDDANVLK